MNDAWNDRNKRSIMDLCVNSLLGTTFLSSFEDSVEAHKANYIFKYVDKCFEDIESNEVIQVLTVNASNNMVRPT